MADILKSQEAVTQRYVDFGDGTWGKKIAGAISLTGGSVAEDAATSASPVIVGGVVRTALGPSTLVAGDAARATMTTNGSVVVKPYSVPETDWQYATPIASPITGVAAVAMKAAVATYRNYVTGFYAYNNSATPSSPEDTNINAETNVPDFANEAIYMNLAVRLAPAFGKTVSPEIRLVADTSYSNMVNQAAIPTPERQLPQYMPRGQGTKPWRNVNNPYLNRPEDPILAGSAGPISFE